MQHRHPEDRHHRVADELLDRAAVALDHPSRRIEVPAHHLPEAFRIEPLPQSRRPGHIAKQHRDRLTLLARRRHRRHGPTAPVAEPGIRRVLLPAGCADPHTDKARPPPSGMRNGRTRHAGWARATAGADARGDKGDAHGQGISPQRPAGGRMADRPTGIRSDSSAGRTAIVGRLNVAGYPTVRIPLPGVGAGLLLLSTAPTP